MDFDVVIVRSRGNEGILAGVLSARLTSRGVRFDGIKSDHGPIYVITRDARAPAAISEVPGVVSCSPAMAVGSSADAAAGFVADVAKNIAATPRTPGYAGYIKLAPADIGRVRGDAVFGAVRKRKPDADLESTKFRVHVELGGSGAYVYTDIVPGPGKMAGP